MQSQILRQGWDRAKSQSSNSRERSATVFAERRDSRHHWKEMHKMHLRNDDTQHHIVDLDGLPGGP